MKMQILPVFKDIFPNEHQPEIKDLIKSIPTDAILKVCCYINSQLYFSKERLKTEIKIFVHFIERIQDDKLRNAPYYRLREFQQKIVGQDTAIFPLPHTLKLIEIAYQSDYIPYDKDTTPEQDLDILKSLLILNSDVNNKTSAIFRETDISSHESIYKVFWSSLLPDPTVFLRKNLVISVYKSVCFLKFLQVKYPKNLEEYVKVNQVDHFIRIPLKLFELYSNGYNREKDFFYSHFKSDIMENNPVILNLSLDVANSSREEYFRKKLNLNYKGIRTYPFLKLKGNEYHISNWNFIIEKFYEGMVFDFFQKTDIRKEKGIGSFENYKSRMGDDFSNVFFMDLMKEIFSALPLICLKDKERNEKCDYDFYIRIKNCVFFFEFKDVLFPINETYDEIKSTIDTKLVSNEKEKHKGIGQIVRHIRTFNTDATIYDDLKKEGIFLKDIVVYPILIYSDHAFGMTGVNDYLNSIFENEIKKDVFSFQVRGLAMISLDFFMEEFDTFHFGISDLVNVLELYYKLKSESDEMFSKNKNPITLQNKYDGFEVTIRRNLDSNSKDLMSSVFFERILNEFKPYLSEE
jgi:hypothetical protein